MNKCFIDTNIFLRFLTNDDPKKALRIEALFQKAISGKIQLTTNHLVIAEIVWTLDSYYGLEKEDIASKIAMILNTPCLEIQQNSFIAEALAIYVGKNIDWIDAYNATYMKYSHLKKIFTYDKKHFTRIEGLQVIEP